MCKFQQVSDEMAMALSPRDIHRWQKLLKLLIRYIGNQQSNYWYFIVEVNKALKQQIKTMCIDTLIGDNLPLKLVIDISNIDRSIINQWSCHSRLGKIHRPAEHP